MIQSTGDIRTHQWILYLCKGIVKEGWIPEDYVHIIAYNCHTQDSTKPFCLRLNLASIETS